MEIFTLGKALPEIALAAWCLGTGTGDSLSSAVHNAGFAQIVTAWTGVRQVEKRLHKRYGLPKKSVNQKNAVMKQVLHPAGMEKGDVILDSRRNDKAFQRERRKG